MPIHVFKHRQISRPSARYPEVHCSAIVELFSGGLLTVWYGGSQEAEPDVALLMSRLPEGTEEWAAPEVFSDTPGKPEGNAILFVTSDGALHCVYNIIEEPRIGEPGPGVRWKYCSLHHAVSFDDGAAWPERRLLREELGWVVRTKPLVCVNGDLVVGLEHKDDRACFMVSSDRGATWEFSGFVEGVYTSQPAIIQRADGSLLALFRSRVFDASGNGWIARSVSMDNGRTWTPAVNTALPNPCAAIDMVKLRDGRVVLAYNGHGAKRNPLTLAISEDDGDTWAARRNVVDYAAREFHYPAIIETRDGLLQLTFTFDRLWIEHVTLDPEWIYGGDT